MYSSYILSVTSIYVKVEYTTCAHVCTMIVHFTFSKSNGGGGGGGDVCLCVCVCVCVW